MGIEKPYQPSPEEMKKAEGMMTEEEKEVSKNRESTFKKGEEEVTSSMMPIRMPEEILDIDEDNKERRELGEQSMTEEQKKASKEREETYWAGVEKEEKRYDEERKKLDGIRARE